MSIRGLLMLGLLDGLFSPFKPFEELRGHPRPPMSKRQARDLERVEAEPEDRGTRSFSPTGNKRSRRRQGRA